MERNIECHGIRCHQCHGQDHLLLCWIYQRIWPRKRDEGPQIFRSGVENLQGCPNLEQNPTKTLRWSAPSSLIVVTILYILVNVAYFSVASREDILSSKQIAAAVFFQSVFGTGGAARALNVLICLSAFGNLVAVLINSSRLLRETGRLVSITRIFSPSLSCILN